MSLHPLHLTPDPGSRDGLAAAFWLSVADRAAWVDGLRRLGPDARAFVLPRAPDDLRPGGAILVPVRPCAANALPWTPCANLWGRVWVPTGRRFEPALTLAEARRFFPCERSFFHPVLGVVGFANADGLALADLLARPPRLAADPTLAQEGVPPLPALGHMALRTMPQVEELLRSGGAGIGEEKPEALNPLKDPGASWREKARELAWQLRSGLCGGWWRNPKFRKVFLWTLAGVIGALLLAGILWWLAQGAATPGHPPIPPKATPPSHPHPAPPAHPPAGAHGGHPWARTLANIAGWLMVILGGLGLAMLALMCAPAIATALRRLCGAWKAMLVVGAVIGGVALLAGALMAAVPIGTIAVPLILVGRFLFKGAGGTGGGSAPARPAAPTTPPPERIQDAREREIERLLTLLEKNPEEGLRYALPLAGEFAGRGRAAPSTLLSLRDLILTMGGGGGGPVDGWIPRVDQQWRLQQKYREQANTALNAGNYERAAYIHAKLLGDWRAAASALAQGRLWQKAAQIYDEKLHDTFNAAHCLEQAGQWEEAADRYARVLQHEKAGDLWHRLGRHEQAETAWRAAVARAHSTREKARILFEKIGDHDAALALLAAAWPGSGEAAACLRLHWKYLDELARHDARLALADRFKRDPSARLAPPENMLAMLEVWRKDESQAPVAEALADVMWTVAGETLAKNPARPHAREILGKVPGLAQRDRMLAEDARRFLARGTEAPAPQPRAKADMTWGMNGSLAHFTTSAAWDDAAAVGREWHMLGRQNENGNRLIAIMTKIGQGETHERRFSIFPYVLKQNAVQVHGLEWGPRRRRTVLSSEAFKALFPIVQGVSSKDPHCLQPAGLADAHAVALQSDHTLFAIVPAATGAVEAQVWKKGKLAATHALTLGEWPLDHRYPVAARDDAFYFAVGPLLGRCRAQEGFHFETDVVDLGEPIIGLAVAPAPFPHRVLAAAGPRAVLVEPDKAFAMHDLYRDPRGDPLLGVVFTLDGHAIPVGAQGAVVHRAGETVEPAGRMTVYFNPDTEFAALTALEEPGSFAYLTRDGNFGAVRPLS